MKKSKLCSNCNKIKSIRDFHKNNNRKDSLQLWCKQCGLKAKRKQYWDYRAKDVKILARKYLLKHKYGINFEDYNELFYKQKGVCAICGKKETQRSNPKGKIDSLRIDHNHKTNKIRGLLCSKCNLGIAQFNDNIKLLSKAIDYLKGQ